MLRPALALVLLASLNANAQEIISRRSSWNASYTRIFTDVTFRHDDGRTETLRVPGGTVDGIGMVQFDNDPSLARSGLPSTLAFVRTKTDAGSPLRWTNSCVFITPDAEGTSDLEGDTEFAVIDAVLAHWRDETSECSYIYFETNERDSGEVGYDGINRIKFRNDTWCRPENGDDPGECYDSQATALTTLFFINQADDPSDGVIVDADIELNSAQYAMSASGQSTDDGISTDLANTLTHEVGHLLGLDHTCWVPSSGLSQPTDNDGDLVPSCYGSLSDEITESTMYNFQDAGETKKATVEQDDIDGICAIYPLADDPGVCEPVSIGGDDGCCAIAGKPHRDIGRWAGLALLILIPLVCRRLEKLSSRAKERACTRAHRR